MFCSIPIILMIEASNMTNLFTFKLDCIRLTT